MVGVCFIEMYDLLSRPQYVSDWGMKCYSIEQLCWTACVYRMAPKGTLSDIYTWNSASHIRIISNFVIKTSMYHDKTYRPYYRGSASVADFTRFISRILRWCEVQKYPDTKRPLQRWCKLHFQGFAWFHVVWHSFGAEPLWRIFWKYSIRNGLIRLLYAIIMCKAFKRIRKATFGFMLVTHIPYMTL